jgi:hypothetical protein
MDNITVYKIKKFCKMANINCDSTSLVKYLNSYKYAPRYLKGLSDKEKIAKKFEIKYYQLLEKTTGKKMYKPIQTDKPYLDNKKISKYTKKWNELYKTTNMSEKSKISGVPLEILKKVYNKGLAAWRGGQHRPGASQHQWGVSRVNSFLTCGKTFYFPDHKLAQEAMDRSKKAKEFWKKCDKTKMGKRTRSK